MMTAINALRFSLATTLGLGLSLLPAAHVAAFCNFSPPTGWVFSGVSTITIRPHADLHTHLVHSDGSPWSAIELEGTLRWVVNRYNASAPTNAPRLVYGAPVTCDWNDFADGCPTWPFARTGRTCDIAITITVVPSDCYGTRMLHPAIWLLEPDPAPNSRILQLQRSMAQGIPGTLYWDGFVAPTRTPLELALLHEIGHAFGQAHPQDCAGHNTMCPPGSEPCSIMHVAGVQGALAPTGLLLDDYLGLRAAYGLRPAPNEELFETLDGGDLQYITPAPVLDLMGQYAASGAPSSSTDLTIVGYSRTWYTFPNVYSWNWASRQAQHLGVASLDSTNGGISASQSDTHRYLAYNVPRQTSDARRWTRRVAVAYRTMAGTSWEVRRTDPQSGTPADTRLPGVSSAWDPTSSSVVIAFRTTGGRVLLQSFNPSNGFSSVLDTNILSTSTPAVACREGTGRNCLLVLANPGYPVSSTQSNLLRRVEFLWNHSIGMPTWNPGLVVTENWMISADPALTVYYPPGRSAEFVLGQLIGPWIVLYTRPPGESSGFVLYRLVAGTHDFALGSANAHLELFKLVHPVMAP